MITNAAMHMLLAVPCFAGGILPHTKMNAFSKAVLYCSNSLCFAGRIFVIYALFIAKM